MFFKKDQWHPSDFIQSHFPPNGKNLMFSNNICVSAAILLTFVAYAGSMALRYDYDPKVQRYEEHRENIFKDLVINALYEKNEDGVQSISGYDQSSLLKEYNKLNSYDNEFANVTKPVISAQHVFDVLFAAAVILGLMAAFSHNKDPTSDSD